MSGARGKWRRRFAVEAERLCKLGATDKDLAAFFGVGATCIDQWKHRHKAFKAALDAGKQLPDTEVEASLYKRATGFVSAEGQAYPPDVTACIFWLKNRRPDAWRDRREHTLGGSLKIDTIEQTIIDPRPAEFIEDTGHSTTAPMIEHQPMKTNGSGRG